MRFNVSNLITGLMFNTIDQLLEFCIYYEVNGIYLPYKDNKLFNDTIVFTISSEIYLYPFRASTLKFLCLNWNMARESNITIAVKGTSYITEDYSWSIENSTIINNFVQYKSVVGTEILYGDSIGMQKNNSLNRLMTNHFGASCFTQPHLCDTGFTVQLNVEVPFSSHDVEFNFRPTRAFYTDKSKTFNEPEIIQFGQSYTNLFLFEDVNLPSNAAVSSFQFLVGSYQGSGGNTKDFMVKVYLLLSQHKSFGYNFVTQLYKNTSSYLSNADYMIFLFNGSNVPCYNSLNLLNLYNNISKKYFGLIKHIGIVIVPNNQVDNNNFVYNRSGFKLAILHRRKVIASTSLSSHAALASSIVYKFNESYYITGIQFQNNKLIKESYVLLSYDFNGYHFLSEFEKESGDNKAIVINSSISTQILKFNASCSINALDVNVFGYKNELHSYFLDFAMTFNTAITYYQYGSEYILFGKYSSYTYISTFKYNVNNVNSYIKTSLIFSIGNYYQMSNFQDGFSVRVYLLLKSIDNVFGNLKNMLYKDSKKYLENVQFLNFVLKPGGNSIDLINLYNNASKYSGSVNYIGIIVMPDEEFISDTYCIYEKKQVILKYNEIDCIFNFGKDGQGGAGENNMGKVKNDAECIAICYKQQKYDLTINGVTTTLDGTSCYCELGMTSQTDASIYKSCYIPLIYIELTNVAAFKTVLTFFPVSPVEATYIILGQWNSYPSTSLFIYNANIPSDVNVANVSFSIGGFYSFQNSDNGFIIRVYLLMSEDILFNNTFIDIQSMMYSYSKLYLSKEQYVTFKLYPKDNNIDLLSIYNNVSKKYSGSVKYIGIIVMPDDVLNNPSTYCMFYKDFITLVIKWNAKETLLTSVPTLQSSVFTFDDTYYITGIEMKNNDIVKEKYVLSVLSSDVFVQDQYVYVDEFELEGGENQYIALNGIVIAKVLNVTYSNNTPDVKFFGGKNLGMASPIISAGIGGYENETQGNGFQVQLNCDNKIVGTVVTKDSMYVAYMENPTKVPYTLTLVWSKQSDSLFLYHDDDLISIGNLSNVTSHPCLYNEYLLVYGDYYNYSDLNTALSGIKMWSTPLSSNEISRLLKETVSDWDNLDGLPPSGFKFGSDCYCKNLVCPCETLDVLGTVEHTSRLTDFLMICEDAYLEDEIIEFIDTNNSEIYFDNIILDFKNVLIQHVYIKSNLVFSSSCFNVTIKFENKIERVQTQWCNPVDTNGSFITPDLVLSLSHLLKTVNYTTPLTIVIVFGGAILKQGSVLIIEYLLPKPGGFIHASAIQKNDEDILTLISFDVTGRCLSFSFKFGGAGYVSLAVLGYTNNFSEELAFFYRREGLDKWVKSYVDLDLNSRNFSTVSFVALKNGLGTGYIALGTIQFLVSCDELFTKELNAYDKGNDSRLWNDSSLLFNPIIFVRGSSILCTSIPNSMISEESIKSVLKFLYGYTEEAFRRTLNISETNFSKDFTFVFWYEVKGSVSNQVISFIFGNEVNISCQNDKINLVVNNVQTYINISSSLQWHYVVVQYEQKFLKLSLEVDFKTIIIDGIQFPQNSSMKVVLESNVLCFQMYNELLFPAALHAAQLCLNKSVKNACIQQNYDCQWCNPFYGEWELYPWQYIFEKNGVCLQDDSNKTLYQPFNLVINGNFVSGIHGSYEVELSSEVQPVLGFINNGLRTESNVVVADQDILSYFSNNAFMFSVWIKHVCNGGNEYRPIISTSVFVLLCGIDTAISSTSTLVFHDNCMYAIPGKSGLWYNFAFIYNEIVKVYIDGQPVLRAECVETTLPFTVTNNVRVSGVSEYPTYLDELLVGDVTPSVLFWRQLTGNPNPKKIKQMVEPLQFDFCVNEQWNYGDDILGEYQNEQLVNKLNLKVMEILRSSIKEVLLLEVVSLGEGSGLKKVCGKLNVYLSVQNKDVNQRILKINNGIIQVSLASQRLQWHYDLLEKRFSIFPDDLLAYYSKFASYKLLRQNRTSVALSLKLFEDERYPVSEIFIQWKQKDSTNKNQFWSNQTNNVVISDLVLFTEYYICFSFVTIRRKRSSCIQQSQTFWTAEGEPVQPPDIVCTLNDANKIMSCEVNKISEDSWKGIPYSYNLIYRTKSSKDNCKNLESELNQNQSINYSLSATEYKFNFNTSDLKSYQLCVIAFATTQRGNGIGVANFIIVKTQSIAPHVAPNGFNAVFSSSVLTFNWDHLENSIDVWNIEKPPGSYKLNYTSVNHSLPISQSLLTTVTVTNNQYILNNASLCHLYMAFINAYSVASGPASSTICILSSATKPDCVNPVIKEYYVVDSRTAIILPQSFDPTYFRGFNKSWLFYVDGTAEYNPWPIPIKYLYIPYNLELSIEKYAERSMLCVNEELSAFLSQQTAYEITLMALHPYTSYQVSIQPCNEYGCGQISNPVSFTTYSDIPSCSPESLQLQNESSTSMMVSWSKLDSSCKNFDSENYILECNGTQSGILNNVNTGILVELFNLQKYELICCRVAAGNINGTGPYSSKICAFTDQDEPTATPIPREIKIESFSGCLEILAPKMVDMNGIVLGILANITNLTIAGLTTSFQQQSYFEDYEFTFKANDLYEGFVNVCFYQLLPSFVYNVELRYFNSMGYGPSSGYQFVTEEYYSEAPSIISFSSDNVSIITVNWSSVPIEKSNGIISQYIICRKQVLSNTTEEVCFNYTNLSVLEFNLTGLDRGSTHNVSVAACNKAGCGKKIYILADAMGFIDGHWLEWSNWGDCSQTCDKGNMMRTRDCTPHTEGGYDCFGNSTDFAFCQLATCSGFVLGSEGQTNCSAVCANKNYLCSPFYLKPYNDTSIFLAAITPINCQTSLTYRLYSSDLNPSFDNSTGVCHGYINIPDEVPCESKSTFNQPNMHRLCNCINPSDYGFTLWARWSFCSETCGNTSKQNRRRNCLGVCTGDYVQTQPCVLPACPVDGEWGRWGDYSECNTTCGYGYRVSTRECNNPATVGSGTPCQGIQRDEEPECNAFPCPVDGGYSNWTDWSVCSRPCGEGVSIRRRYCNNPVPALRGKECNGSDLMTMPCIMQNCTPIQVDIIQKTFETWTWKMYNTNSDEARVFIQRFNKSIYKYFKENGLNGLKSVDVSRLVAGSIVVYYTLTFDYLYDQMVEFVDGINQVGKILNISIENTQLYSSNDVSCPPPRNISAVPHNENTVFIKWIQDACIKKTDIWLYVYYKDLTELNSTWKWRGLESSKQWGLLPNLITSHKYKAYMLTALSIGNGLPSDVFYFQTSAYPPERPPPHAYTFSPSSTSIYIEWTDIPEKYQNGAILGYRIRYKIYRSNETFQKADAQFGFNAFTIKNLKPFTLYYVEVYGYNVIGDGPVQYSMCKTIEGVPSIPVPRFVVNDMQSISWWSVSWGPIPSEFVNGVLLGYRLVYYLSYRSGVEISGEKTKVVVTLDKYARYYKQTDLINYAIYSVSVAGFTAAGSGPAPEYQARTCKCPKLLYGNLFVKNPFTSLDAGSTPGGFFVNLLQDMVIKSCGSCQGYDSSQLYFTQSKSGDDPVKTSEFDLKNSINNDVDLSFPIYGINGREVAPDSVYSQLVISPGIAMIVRNENTIDQVINKMMLGVLDVWPVLLISYAIASVFGIFIWFADQFTNPSQFSRGSSLRGPCSGFWFTFVTMTTIGYGDLSPRSVLARTFAMVWFLTGLILNGLIIAFIVTNLTTLTSSTEYMLYDTKVAALNNSLEIKIAIIRNAKISQDRYTNVPSMLEDLQNKVVDIVYVDALSLLDYKSVLDKKSLTIISIDNMNTGYGFVMSGASAALTIDINSFISSKSNEISAFVTSFSSRVPELSVDDASQILAGIFSKDSPAFKKSLIGLSIMIFLFIIGALIFEIMLKKNYQVKVEATYEMQLELMGYVSEFQDKFSKTAEDIYSQHDEERVQLSDLKRFYKNKVKRIGLYETERLVKMNNKYRFISATEK